MGKTIICATNYAGGVSTANTDQYWNINGVQSVSSTEDNKETLFKTAGTLSGLIVKISANSVAATSTFTLRKNNGDATQVLSIGSSATGDFEDTTHTDSIVADDDVVLKTHPGAAAGTYTLTEISLLFAATTNTVQMLTSFGASQSFTAASTTSYISLHGEVDATATEANNKCRMRKAGTFRNASIFVSANRATATTVRLRKNAGNGNIAISITGGGATGFYEDTSNTDVAAAGEDWNYSLTTGTGADTLTVRQVQVESLSTAADGIIMCVESAGTAISDNTNRFFMPSGPLTATTTETGATGVQLKSRGVFTLTQLTCLVTQNDVSSASTCRTRVGAANGAQAASITGNTTGVFSDTTNTDTLTSSSQINYQVSVPSVSGAHTVTVQNIICNTHDKEFVIAVPTETVTISESAFTRLAAKNRTGGTQTVTISEAAFTRLAAKNRALSTQTVVIAEDLQKVRSRPRSPAAETVTISEASLTRMTAKIRTASDTTTIGESLTRLCAKMRSLATETVTVGSGTLTRIKGVMRSLSTETVVIGESLARMCAKIRTNVETTVVGESLTRLKAAMRSLATETITIGSGTLTRIKGSIRTISDTIIVGAGTLTRLAAKNRALSTETVTVTGGTLTRLAAKIRALATEVIAVADDVAREVTSGGANNVHRIIEETVVVGDSVARMCAKIRALSTQTVTSGESLARLKAAMRSLGTETVTISEASLNRLAAKIRTASDTVVSGESLSRLCNKIRTASDTVVSGESLTRLAAKIRSLATETVVIGDNVAQAVNDNVTHVVRTLTETVVITEASLARLCNKFRTNTETTISAEQKARTKSANRSLATESITIGAGTVVRLCGKIRVSVETVVSGESLNRLATKFRTISETVLSTEQLTRIKGVNRALATQTTVISDSINRLCGKIRNPIENVVSGESLARMATKFRSIIETVNLSESVNVFTPQNVQIVKELIETVIVSDNLDRFVSLLGLRSGRGGAGGRRIKRYNFILRKYWPHLRL